MAGRYKAYPEYKDSGVEWLGNVPLHWKLSRLGGMFDERSEKVSDKDFSALSVTKDGIVPQLDNAAKTDSGDNRKKVCVDDFVINSRSDRKGSSGTSKLNGSVSLISIVLSPTGIYPDFAHHLLRSYPFQNEFYRYGKGIHADLWSTNYSEMKNIILAMPDDREQQKIANFLDYETAKIDTLIAKQEKLIELLKEKRQAVISHAVTKGLNPDAPMRDSGVEWLGEVPEHWQVVRLRFLCEITTGSRDTQDAKAGGQYPFYVRSDNIQSIDTYSFDGEGVMTSGDGAGVGKIFHHFIGKCEIHQRVYLFHKFRLITPRYFYHYLKQNLEPIALAQSAKSTVDSLRLPILQEFSMCFGNETEQNEICLYVDSLNEKYAALIQSASRAIELMKERKTALISAAVTGKIDVRDFVSEQGQPQGV